MAEGDGPDWDKDSPELRANLASVMAEVGAAAVGRGVPSCGEALRWHVSMMHGLKVPYPKCVGIFRGGIGLEGVNVEVGGFAGVPASDVGGELARFERRLQASVRMLDAKLPPDGELNNELLAAVIDLCAWVHAEWIRIHPLANGNGRTARLWANYVAMRYGLPPFVRLRPRPDLGYGRAGAKAMQGEWRPTVSVFRRLLDECLGGRL